MTVPAELLGAISAPGGGRVALIVGAGCSVEAPTGIPAARKCSEEIHRRLVADGVLQNGECDDPEDLSRVADAVFQKTGGQKAVVQRLSEEFPLKVACPNDGHLIAAAMLSEGAISAIVTLNFDLALSNALSQLGIDAVGIVECPQDLAKQRAINVFYLHRNVNASDPEVWVLRSATLATEWQSTWQPIIATRVLTTPVVVFAGLGTPVQVLIESTRLLRNAIPNATTLFQVDPLERSQSRFFKELRLDPSAYLQSGWCDFMEALAARLVAEHISQLRQAIKQKASTDHLLEEDVSGLLATLDAGGLVRLGAVRARWLLHGKPYRSGDATSASLMADLLLAVGMVARLSGATVFIVEDGLVEFRRNGRIVATYMVASGSGHQGRTAVEAAVELRRARYRNRPTPLQGVIVGGTSDVWSIAPTPPRDVVRGDVVDDIVGGASTLTMVHVQDVRTNQAITQQMVP